MNRLTFSRLQLAKECPASMVLPWVERLSPEAQNGTDLHSFVEKVREFLGAGFDLATAREMALALVPETIRPAAEAMDLTGIPLGPNSVSEVKFAINAETGEAYVLLNQGHRNYDGIPDTHIAGTADCIDEDETYRIVGELKTGETFIPHPKDNLQIRAVAYAVHKIWPGKPVLALLNIRSATKKVDISHVFSEADHVETLKDLQRIYYAIREAEKQTEECGYCRMPKEGHYDKGICYGWRPRVNTLNVREGDHCRYCPAMASCPAKANLARSLIEIAEGALTPDRLREVFLKVRSARDIIDRMEKTLAEFARKEAIDLGDGRHYGLTTENQEKVDAEKLLKLYPEAAACVDIKVSKGALERWGQKHWGDRHKAFMGSLRRAGVLESRQVEMLKIHKKKAG